MNFVINASTPSYILLVVWVFSLIIGLYLGVIRSMIDRIRAGISTPPGEDTRPGKLLDSILCEPNHARPLHVEAALFSALQLFFGFLYLISLWKEDPLSVVVISSFILHFSGSVYFLEPFPKYWLRPIRYHLHLALGYPFVLFSRLFTWPFSFVLLRIENLFSFSGGNRDQDGSEENEVADHIRTLSREGSNLDPDIAEIVGNTLEMGQLKVQDIMVSRKQVQILDVGGRPREKPRNCQNLWAYPSTPVRGRSRSLPWYHSC